MWEELFAKPLQGIKSRSCRSVTLVKSRVDEKSPPQSVLDPKDEIRAYAIVGIIKLLWVAHVRTHKVKIWGRGEIIVGAARSHTG